MLQRIALLAISAPRRIVAIAALVMVACGIFGIPVAKSLSAGGFQDPTSESAQGTQLLVNKFGQGDMELVISVTDESAAAGARSPAARAVATDIVAQLQQSAGVAQVTSAWTAPESAAPALVSKDGKTGLIVAGITGGESGAQKHAKELTDRLVGDRDGVTVRAGGMAMTYVQINAQTEKDLLMMEAIAIPLSFIVLVWVFGGLTAAALPLAVGGFAILGSMAVLRGITFVTDVSIFAMNLTIAMGLALAIDYTLLIISRYRDELAEGADRDRALIRTVTSWSRRCRCCASTTPTAASASTAGASASTRTRRHQARADVPATVSVSRGGASLILTERTDLGREGQVCLWTIDIATLFLEWGGLEDVALEHGPTAMPWGHTEMAFRDPDGGRIPVAQPTGCQT